MSVHRKNRITNAVSQTNIVIERARARERDALHGAEKGCERITDALVSRINARGQRGGMIISEIVARLCTFITGGPFENCDK